jgi:arylsulfatase A-like enzyme
VKKPSLSLAGFRVGACFVLFALAAACAAERSHRPNVVVFIADDLGWEETTPYGHPVIRTPNLQRLADEGLRFDRFFLTASSCSPSRSSMFSGRYPHNTGAMNLHVDLKPEVELFIEPLRAAGYHTMLIGKSHGTNHPQVKTKFDRMALADWSRPWIMGDMWEQALRGRPAGQPFFLWASSIDPHRPYKQGDYAQPHDPAKVVVPPYYPDLPEMREDLADYYNEIERFDAHVGQAMRVLDEQGILDDTVILVLTDNGRAFPKAKTRINVPGVKSPLLVRYPPLVARHGVAPGLVSAVDLAPTILELAGAPALRQTDGVSFVPILRDPTRRIRPFAFAEHNWHTYSAYERAAITEDFVYIRNWLPELPGTPPGEVVPVPSYQAMARLFDAGRLAPEFSDTFFAPRPAEELYAIAADPSCMRNLAADPASQATRTSLRRELDAWQQRTGDRFPGKDKLKPDEADRRTGQLFKKTNAPSAPK